VAARCFGGIAEIPQLKNNFNSASPCATRCLLSVRRTASFTCVGELRN